jgi:hypothetical protein
MKKLLAGIAALGVCITSPAIANAQQIVTSMVSEDSANSLINKGSNISDASLSSRLNDKQLIAQSVARLNFSWRTAPLELAVVATEFIVKGKTSNFIALAVLLASGHDVYVARVTLHNTGNVPLRVYPQNIKVYYGNKSTNVIPIADNRFLQPDILEPNYYIEKPVIFIAPYGLNLLNHVEMAYRG